MGDADTEGCTCKGLVADNGDCSTANGSPPLTCAAGASACRKAEGATCSESDTDGCTCQGLMAKDEVCSEQGMSVKLSCATDLTCLQANNTDCVVGNACICKGLVDKDAVCHTSDNSSAPLTCV